MKKGMHAIKYLITSVLVLAVWSYLGNRNKQQENILFLAIMLIATVLLASTAWRGGELVYRHGMGVMSLPDSGEHDHGAHDRAVVHDQDFEHHLPTSELLPPYR